MERANGCFCAQGASFRPVADIGGGADVPRNSALSRGFERRLSRISFEKRFRALPKDAGASARASEKGSSLRDIGARRIFEFCGIRKWLGSRWLPSPPFSGTL